MATIAVSKDNFQQILDKHDIVVLDFWAEWCGPCKAFEATYEGVSQQFPDIVFGKVDASVELDLVKDFAIRSVPFLMILRDRVVVYSDSGTLPASAFIDLLNQTKALDSQKLKEQKSHHESE